MQNKSLIKNIRDKIKHMRILRRRNAYYAAALAGIMTVGKMQKPIEEKPKEKVEIKVDVPQKMSFEEEKDAYLMPILPMIEGCALEAYKDDVGVWTYGVGNIYTKDGHRVKEGDKLGSIDEALDLSHHYIDEDVEDALSHISRELTPYQKAAVSSFLYNCGSGILVKDGKLTKLGEALNNGDDEYFLETMLKYNKGKGKFMRGLFGRRALEAFLFQNYVSIEDLQKSIVGGLGNASRNKEINEIFKLKHGRYDASAIYNPEVAEKFVRLCQIPVTGKLSEKNKAFHVGEPVETFLTPNIRVSEKNKQKEKFFMDVVDVVRNVRSISKS